MSLQLDLFPFQLSSWSRGSRQTSSVFVSRIAVSRSPDGQLSNDGINSNTWSSSIPTKNRSNWMWNSSCVRFLVRISPLLMEKSSIVLYFNARLQIFSKRKSGRPFSSSLFHRSHSLLLSFTAEEPHTAREYMMKTRYGHVTPWTTTEKDATKQQEWREQLRYTTTSVRALKPGDVQESEGDSDHEELLCRVEDDPPSGDPPSGQTSTSESVSSCKSFVRRILSDLCDPNIT